MARGQPISGGATWTSYSLDPDTGLLYVPGGNPSPDFAATVRGGGNLYTNSVVVLDARTGAYKEHFKIVPKIDLALKDQTPSAVLLSGASRDSRSQNQGETHVTHYEKFKERIPTQSTIAPAASEGLALRSQQPGLAQLIEMCRVVDTVLVDQETIYAPRHGTTPCCSGSRGR
jgi:hypothetical protein